MSYNVHTTTTQSSNLASSLLNTPFVPATAPKAPRGQRNRRKVHQCNWQGCGRLFECPHNVQQHIREAHTLEKPYECDDCAAQGVFSAFSRQGTLNRHKRQVHFVGAKPSKVVPSTSAGDLTNAAVPQWTSQPQLVGNDGFVGMGAMLTHANFEMGAVSGDVEMSDAQFQFDAAPSDISISGAQNSGSLTCGECDYAAAENEDILMHMHAVHGVPNTRFCVCNVCSMMFMPSEDDAINHAMLLGNGALNAPSDASFTQDGPNVNMAPAWSSQLGPDDATGWETVDPAMLSFTSI
jgi:hypothetical protein